MFIHYAKCQVGRSAGLVRMRARDEDGILDGTFKEK